MQEGMIWEAAMAAAHYGLDSLVRFVTITGYNRRPDQDVFP